MDKKEELGCSPGPPLLHRCRFQCNLKEGFKRTGDGPFDCASCLCPRGMGALEAFVPTTPASDMTKLRYLSPQPITTAPPPLPHRPLKTSAVTIPPRQASWSSVTISTTLGFRALWTAALKPKRANSNESAAAAGRAILQTPLEVGEGERGARDRHLSARQSRERRRRPA